MMIAQQAPRAAPRIYARPKDIFSRYDCAGDHLSLCTRARRAQRCQETILIPGIAVYRLSSFVTFYSNTNYIQFSLASRRRA